MMKPDLSNKVVVVTGGGGGIGRAIAQKLAQDKMKIVLLGGNNIAKLREAGESVEQHAECLVLPGDLTDLAFMEKGVEQIMERFGGIDILINNAGMALSCPFEEVSEDEFDKIMAINVKTPFFLTQKMIPHLKKSDCASIINLSSAVGHMGYPLQSAYAASKHAILGFTKSLANEYYKHNIRVHAICPGGVYTDMVKIARPDLTPEGMIMPEEIADIVYFFLSNRGNGVVDEIIVHRVNKEPFQI